MKTRCIDITLVRPIEIVVGGTTYEGYITPQHITQEMVTDGLYPYGVLQDKDTLSALTGTVARQTFLTNRKIPLENGRTTIDDYRYIEYIQK